MPENKDFLAEEPSSPQHVGQHVMALGRLARTYVDPRLAPLGIGFSQAQMLIVLYERDGVSQDVLAKRLHITKGAMTRTIQRLVAAGYVERLPDPDDDRAYKIVLTEKAWRDCDTVRAVLRGWTSGTTTGFTKKEAAQLRDLLVRMVGNAAELADGGTAEAAATPNERPRKRAPKNRGAK